MLQTITLKNFVSIPFLEIDFHKGLTTLTGETGAGKSLLLEAISLALGKKVHSKLTYDHTRPAEITVSFKLPAGSPILNWLTENDITPEEDFYLQRIIYADGRTRTYANSHPIALNSVKQLAAHLVHIHRQHEHYSLLESNTQKTLLDKFGKLEPLVDTVEKHFLALSSLHKSKEALMAEYRLASASLPLLKHEIEELSRLDLTPDKITLLEQKHRKYCHLSTLMGIYQQAHQRLEECLAPELQVILKQLQEAKRLTEDAAAPSEILIQIELLLRELAHSLNQLLQEEAYPEEELAAIEKQIETLHHLSRKHQTSTQDLPKVYTQLIEKQDNTLKLEKSLQTLDIQIEKTKKHYFEAATHLTLERTQTALLLQSQISHYLKTLDLALAEFQIRLIPIAPQEIAAKGQENIEFWLKTHPTLPFNPLKQVASGGELSRISLAIDVATAKVLPVSTLIFDEVDVGISGATAETVGKLLHLLSKERQVLCVTHLPQVAAEGDHHLKISKIDNNNAPETHIEYLTPSKRATEIARLLSGKKITAHTKAQAKEMLEA